MRNHIFFFFVMVGFVTAEDKGGVSFSGMDVTVHCYNGHNVKSAEKKINDTMTFTEPYPENKFDIYSCQDSLKFYIKAKVCPNCYDLDGSLVAAVICADLLITGGIILLVYNYGQRKSGPAPPKPTNARNPAGSGGPPVPNPDYQPLSDFNRSKDTYATVHKTG